MTHVVTDSCIRCKYTDCVDVCPVECFHEGPHFLVIDPDVCVDCAVCVAECPAGAIYDEADLPAEFVKFLDLNKRLSQQWPLISEKKEALPDVERWKDKKSKLVGIDL